ncbi:hypothetical protein BDP81DRAFT_431896 [Colletotrichum phormii]|uniref:Uncharacterized protein n=1 Tax=Colletotrichum phormii TaxID=359342 RepID=A0AAI9ZQ35_9PEZI|nr:uncharacterized protein BDP81DRAFT_431896 [Colletotrichum phormii]KAK1634739.1 hypothetical protein BDP81DRAFT_431896 [Colletotrichum phormii]
MAGSGSKEKRPPRQGIGSSPASSPFPFVVFCPGHRSSHPVWVRIWTTLSAAGPQVVLGICRTVADWRGGTGVDVGSGVCAVVQSRCLAYVKFAIVDTVRFVGLAGREKDNSRGIVRSRDQGHSARTRMRQGDLALAVSLSTLESRHPILYGSISSATRR